MDQQSSAELQRRAREWLRVESSDPAFDAAFEQAKQRLAYRIEDALALMVVGEFKPVRTLLHDRHEPVLISMYRAASGAAPETSAEWPEVAPDQTNPIVHFACGMLGFRPDAARGRLRLRPRLPDAWTFARIENLRIGDALISLRYDRTPRVVRFQIEQIAGAIPVRLIFEPIVRGRIETAAVDGVPADLNFIVMADEVMAPVQIMLDAVRVVEFTPGMA